MGRVDAAVRAAAPRCVPDPRRPALLALVLLAVWIGSCQTPREQAVGTVHEVRAGETVYGIARRYGVPASAILAANDIGDARSIAIGTRLWIPGTGEPEPPRGGRVRPAFPPAEQRRSAQHHALSRANLRFAWPLHGEVTSGFGVRGGRVHEGIDVAARPGTTIRAAESGRVAFAGSLGAYGKTVVVRHEGAYATVYAHNRRNRVRKGASVVKGAVLAELGATGNATGPHLHFEIRLGERAEDPLLYLP
jgi:murein DD-endopeptidase MepM/ murein hydrolase activator NlpD